MHGLPPEFSCKGDVSISDNRQSCNAAKAVEQLVQTFSSVSLQSVEWTCIVVADSRDSSEAITAAVAGAGQRARIVFRDDPLQAMTALASAVATGEFVTFLAPGDLMAPEYLKKTMEHARRYNADVVLGDVRVFDRARAVLRAPQSVAQILAFPWFPLAITVRRDVFRKLEPAKVPGGFELADLAVRLLASANRFSSLNEPLYLYRQVSEHPEFSRSISKFMDAHEKLYQENWQEILSLKDARISALTEELAPKYEQLKQEHEELQDKFANLKTKHEALEEHHAQSLSSVKVTGVHLIRSILSRVTLKRC